MPPSNKNMSRVHHLYKPVWRSSLPMWVTWTVKKRAIELFNLDWLEVGVGSGVLLHRVILMRYPQEVIHLALMMVLMGFF